VLSAALCVAVAIDRWSPSRGAGGIRERWVTTPAGELGVESVQDWLQLSFCRSERVPGQEHAPAPSVAWGFSYHDYRTVGFTPRRGWLGVGWGTERTQLPDEIIIWSSVVAPHWLWIAGTAVMPLLRIVGAVERCRRRRQFREAGLCPECGYDCRATTDRCPECGHPVP
jgi:hypothetical protein